MMDFKEVKSCRICKSHNLKPYLELPDVPLCNNLEVHTINYPVKLLFCENCSLSQLSIVVDPKLLYSTYAYHSSVSETFKQHCYKLAFSVRYNFNPPDHALVVDIASNDGCLLREFKNAGFTRLMGIEPAANLASWKTCYPLEDLISVLPEFWSEKVAYEYIDKANGAHFITATNVLAHVDDLDDFLKGVKIALKDDGVFIAEFPYLPNLIAKNQFDTVYHEHLSYFLLRPLIYLFESHGLNIFMAEEVPIHGGSLRIYASKDKRKEDESVERLLEIENELKLYNFSTYLDFTTQVYGIGEEILFTLDEIRQAGKKVMGYGASAKGISLLNYFGIGKSRVHSIVDDTPDKQGKLTPGSNIPIVPFSQFEIEKPDYILLLSWNFEKELRAKCWWFGGKFIVPIPEVRVD